MTELKLHTASWSGVWRHSQAVGAGNEGFMPVRTSVGLPRFWPEACAFPVAKSVTPFGLRHLEGRAFRDAYVARLERVGVDAIRSELGDIAAAYCKPLALLCFEKLPSECHRALFARFWQDRTGEVVSELDLASGQNCQVTSGQLRLDVRDQLRQRRKGRSER